LTPDQTRFQLLRATLLAVLGIVLAWQIVTRGFAAYLAHEAPSSALPLRADEPVALIALADNRLNPRPQSAPQATDGKDPAMQGDGDRIAGWAELALKAAADKLPLDRNEAAPPGTPLSDADRRDIRAQAELALMRDPINARALRILGQLAAADGDDARATKFMRAAARRSNGESVAVYWMLQTTFDAKSYAETVGYADTFLRKRPQFMENVAPMLAQIAESSDRKAIDDLEQVLARKPPWRSSFFYHLPRRSGDARTPLNILLSLKDTAAPPAPAELSRYLSTLIEHKFYEIAYYTWLQFLPADELGRIGFLSNGSFESDPSGLPFDWVIAQGTGVTIDIAARPDASDKRALSLELGPGRVDFSGVAQMLMLAPGSYKLDGRLKGELRGKRGLQWRLTCAGSGALLAEGPMFVGNAPAWTDFDIPFTVPDADCRAQELRLALASRSASEQLVSGSVWYDDLELSRLPDAAVGP
jgi:hypothetical protein